MHVIRQHSRNMKDSLFAHFRQLGYWCPPELSLSLLALCILSLSLGLRFSLSRLPYPFAGLQAWNLLGNSFPIKPSYLCPDPHPMKLCMFLMRLHLPDSSRFDLVPPCRVQAAGHVTFPLTLFPEDLQLLTGRGAGPATRGVEGVGAGAREGVTGGLGARLLPHPDLAVFAAALPSHATLQQQRKQHQHQQAHHGGAVLATAGLQGCVSTWGHDCAALAGKLQQLQQPEQPQLQQQQQPQQPPRYDLVSVIVHLGGSSSSGHYIAYRRCGTGGTSGSARGVNPSGVWYRMSDTQVHPVDADEVLQAEATALFYERQG